MRRLLTSVALVLTLAGVASARTGQNPTGGLPSGGAGGVVLSTEKMFLWFGLSGFAPQGTPPTQPVTPATAGLYNCSIVTAPRGGTFTKLACAITVGLAATSGECGIFDSAGAARIASTGPIATTAAATLSKTGLSFTLTAGTNYLACWADSATATVAYRANGTPGAYQNQYVNTTFNSGAGATQVAPFNEACTAGSTPYTCCTGLGTGTCNGMADRTGVQGLTAASVIGPLLTVAP